jgi:enoyl-CoA hydratase
VIKGIFSIALRQLAHSMMMDLSLRLGTQSNVSIDHQEAEWAFAQKSRPNFTDR